MNAIKSTEHQNHNGFKISSSSTTTTNNNNNNTRRRHTYVGTASITSEVEINSWKHNAVQSQVYR